MVIASPVFQSLVAVISPEGPNYLCRVTGGDDVGGDVTDHHAPGTDDAVITNRNPTDHGYTSAKPDVITYRDGTRFNVARPTTDRVFNVVRGVKAALRAKLDLIAKLNRRAVHEKAVVVSKEVTTQKDVTAKLNMKVG